MSSFAIVNVDIFTGGGFNKGGVIVQDSKIEAVRTTAHVSLPSGIHVVDGTNKYLIPGLIDSHVHISTHGEPILKQMAKFGITTALDMACWPPMNWKPYCSNESAYQARTDRRAVCDIRSAGAPATVPGSTHSRIPGLAEYVISDPSLVAEWVSARVSEGSHYIKVITDIPVGPSEDLLNNLVQAAHKEGKFVVAHAAQAQTFEMVVNSDADVLTHCPTNEVLDDEVISKLANSKSKLNPHLPRICIPTMSIMKAFSAKFGPPSGYETSVKSLTKMYGAGVPIVAGSDSNLGDSPVAVVHGESLHAELELMQAAGMSNLELLQSATTSAAKYFDGLIGDRGSIEAGKRADLVLLSSNPLDSISNTRQIEKVWIEGMEVDEI